MAILAIGTIIFYLFSFQNQSSSGVVSKNTTSNNSDVTSDSIEENSTPFSGLEKIDLEIDSEDSQTAEDVKGSILNYIFGDEEFRNENLYNLMSDTINIAVIDKYDINAFFTRLDVARRIDVKNYEKNFIEINYTIKDIDSTDYKFRCTQILNVYLIANICRDSSNRIDLDKSTIHFVKKYSDHVRYRFVQRINEDGNNRYNYIIDTYPYYNVALYNIFQEYAYIYENIDEAILDNTGNKLVVIVNIDDMQIVYDHPKLFESNNKETDKFLDMIINELLEQESIVKVENNYIFNVVQFAKKYPVLLPQGKFGEFLYYSDYKNAVVNLTYEEQNRSIRIIFEFYDSGSNGNKNVTCSDENGTKQININGKTYQANVCKGDRIAGNVVRLVNINGYDVYIQAVDYSMNPEDDSLDIMPREFRFMTADEAPEYEVKVQQ